jgi:hypothetical protein
MPSSMKKSSKSSKSKSLSALSDKVSSSVSLRHFENNNELIGTVIGVAIAILYNVLIIMYLNNLEDVTCKCVMDWRHNYIKYFSGFMIVMSIFTLIFTLNKSLMIVKILNILVFVFGIVNTYGLFTYIGELDSTKCTCAVQKQYNMHYFLYVWRWVLVIVFVIMLINILMYLRRH